MFQAHPQCRVSSQLGCYTYKTSRLHEHIQRVIYQGDREAARYVLRCYADRKGWTDETFRARWDGVGALLVWWDALDPRSRPPLVALDGDDAQAFLAELEARGLARTTIRGYRAGARALIRALNDFSTIPTDTADPFKDVALLPPKRIYKLDPALLSQQKPLTALRLEVLVALLNLGMSVPEVCTVRHSELILELGTRLQATNRQARGASSNGNYHLD